ncbi:MAG: radical SAM family heme chaperone HemW [Ignavibacterium sp.]|nr:radical SAM family heme chaperone HemW [Ignavibacterium sp.]MDW8375976.1 radical SAM family heme chaperone HemW [Ignavibacteriales bacterium]
MLENLKDASLYIHIPFCEHKCIYCDFYSIITFENQSEFIKCIKSEIDFYSENYFKDCKFSTIFFGGGTPSILEAVQIEEILNHLFKKFNFSDNLEITLETNPGTVDVDKLKSFKEVGINRLSIGIQSFDENDLKFLTRIHDKETAIKTVETSFASGIENINIDLIFNLPNQTKDKWEHNLDVATKLPIKHISAYSLILERGTILNKLVLDGKVKIQDEDYDADLYQFTINYLTSCGFDQYEVSNFAKVGFECQHNLAYWSHKDYLGIGPSAHSFRENKRWWNFSSLKRYINEINLNGHAKMSEEILSVNELEDEYIMLALRSKGLNLQKLTERFGNDWITKSEEKINQYIQSGFMIKQNDLLKMTSSGYAVCDEILKNLL